MHHVMLLIGLTDFWFLFLASTFINFTKIFALHEYLIFSASVVKINILGHQQILQLLIGYLEDVRADQLYLLLVVLWIFLWVSCSISDLPGLTELNSSLLTILAYKFHIGSKVDIDRPSMQSGVKCYIYTHARARTHTHIATFL